MHNHLDLILTLTGGLAAALIFGYATHRMRLSPIVGYLLAGLAIGPTTPGFVANKELADQLAEVGVLLLMFGVGLQFHLSELLAVKRVAVPGAVVQISAATILGTLVGLAFGWPLAEGVVFGLALSVASTVVLTRVLSDNNELHTPTGHIAVGWLVVEDLFTVLALVLLPAIFGPEADPEHIPWALSVATFKLCAMMAFTFIVGGRVIPWILSRVAATRSRELFTLTVLVLALGIAVGSAKLFGASMALGAFLAGMVVGRSEFSLRAASDALPMRDAFAVLFFVSVGMLFDPRLLFESPLLVALTLLVVIIGKPLAALGIVLVMGYPVRVALAVSVALAQIGEFTFILAYLANELNVLSMEATRALVAASIVSITLNPLLYRAIDPVEAWARKKFPHWRIFAGRTSNLEQDVEKKAARQAIHTAVIVGYGPVGRTSARLLRESGIEPVIIEMNLDTVRRLRAEGIHAVYGDAARQETLEEAGIRHSLSLILSASSVRASSEVIRLAKDLNPRILVIARSSYLREARELREAGADSAFSGEGEVALAVTVFLLGLLRATPDQIDRERDRIRDELFREMGSLPDELALPEVMAQEEEHDNVA